MLMPTAFAIPIVVTHNHIHKGRVNDGRIFIPAHTANTISARLSILEPSSLTVPSFLAKAPSIISETPPQQYSVQNQGLKTGESSIANPAMPLDEEIMLGTGLILFSSASALGKAFGNVPSSARCSSQPAHRTASTFRYIPPLTP